MTKFIQKIKNFTVADAGAAPVEYGIILGLIVAVGGTALSAIGTNTDASIDAACGVVANTHAGNTACLTDG